MINELIERIRAQVPSVKFVGSAVDFQTAVENQPPVTPAVFVIPLEDIPDRPSVSDLFVTQRVRASVGIVLVVRNVSDTKGVAASADIEVLRKLVKDQVFGWQAAPQFDPFERGRSHLLAFRESHMWWQDQYSTSYFDRSVL